MQINNMHGLLSFFLILDQVGGPSWTVKLGRRDSTTASKSEASSDLPLFTDDLDTLISRFTKKGLTARDMVTLSGNSLIMLLIFFFFHYFQSIGF